jgi:hypothetical protein
MWWWGKEIGADQGGLMVIKEGSGINEFANRD